MKTNIIRLKDCENSKKFANWCWQTSAVNTSINYFNAVVPDEVGVTLVNAPPPVV